LRIVRAVEDRGDHQSTRRGYGPLSDMATSPRRCVVRLRGDH
jgi:hypothetical protein